MYLRFIIIIYRIVEYKMSEGDAQGYKKISDTFKELVDTLTTKELSQIKLYLTNMSQKIAAGQDKFFLEFKDLKDLLDNIK